MIVPRIRYLRQIAIDPSPAKRSQIRSEWAMDAIRLFKKDLFTKGCHPNAAQAQLPV